jgi:hypothetical protein
LRQGLIPLLAAVRLGSLFASCLAKTGKNAKQSVEKKEAKQDIKKEKKF